MCVNLKRNSVQPIIEQFPVEHNEISFLFTKDVHLLESQFVADLLEAYSEKSLCQLDYSGKLTFLTFDSLANKDWKLSDFVIICENTPVIFLDHVKPISLNNKDLLLKFRIFIGSWFFV
jgi:hypothetical protein